MSMQYGVFLSTALIYEFLETMLSGKKTILSGKIRPQVRELEQLP